GIDNQVNDFRNHQSWNVPGYIGEFNAFGTGSDTWKYAIQRFDTNGLSWSDWSYKAIHGSPPDSWGVYDPTGTWPAKPNIQTDSANAISNKWAAWGTSAAFASNAMLLPALGAPVAAADSYQIPHATTLAVSAASGTLANDRDVNLGLPGIQLSASWVDGPANGTLALNTDGSFTYQPGGAFAGTDSFRYRVFDGFAQSANIGTVSLQVGPATNRPQLQFVGANGQLQLSWPLDHLGWRLQAQTNTSGTGLGTNWGTVSG